MNDGTTNSASNKEAPPNGTGDLRRLSAISANQLNRLAEDSERRKYNRLLIENFKAEGTGWGIMPTFAHQHVKGEQSETHIRCVITKVDEIIAFLDVSLAAAECILGWDSSEICRRFIKGGITDVASKSERLFHRSLRRQGVAREKLEAATTSVVNGITSKM